VRRKKKRLTSYIIPRGIWYYRPVARSQSYAGRRMEGIKVLGRPGFVFKCLFVVTTVALPAMGGSAPLIGVEENTGNFYAISTTDASVDLIGNSGVTGLGTLEFNPFDGFFYGFTTGSSPVLYRFSVAPALDGVTSEAVGPLGVFAFEGALAFAPDGTAYALNAGITVPALFTIDLDTGEASVINSMARRHDIAGLGWRSDGMLIGLDSTDNALLAINPLTAAVTTINGIAPTIGGVGGMALLDGVGYFVTGGPLGVNPGSNELYSFDVLNGTHLLIGDFANSIGGTGFSGLSIVPEPATLGLFALGAAALLLRRRRRVHSVRN